MITTSDINKGKDYVYYNVSISHDNRLSPNGAPTKMIFNETRDDPIVDNPSEYHGSVVRFSIPSNLIPLTRIYIQPKPNTDINLTVYSVTLQHVATNNFYTQYLVYEPQDNISKVPTEVYNIGDPNYIEYAQYYFIYSTQQFINMINTAFIRALSKMNSAIPNANKFAPYIFRSTSDKFGINIPESYITPNSSTAKQTSIIRVFMNTKLNVYFSNSFNTKLIGYNRPNGDDVEFIVDDLSYNHLINVPTSAISSSLTDVLADIYTYPQTITANTGFPAFINSNIYSMEQEYDTLPLWYEPLSLSLVSIGIPVKYELLPTSGISLSSQGSNIGTNLINQITDFDMHTSIGNEYRTFIQYFPTAEYRFFDMTSNAPLKTFTVQAFWKDNYNNYYPIYLPSFYTANIKILFKKKNI